MSETGTGLANTVQEALVQVRQTPDIPAPRHRLAELLIAGEAWADAEQTVRETLRRFPRNPRAQSDLRQIMQGRAASRDRPAPAPRALTTLPEPEPAPASPEPPPPPFWTAQAASDPVELPAATIFEREWPHPTIEPAPAETIANRRVATPPRAMSRPAIPLILVAVISVALMAGAFLIARMQTLQHPIEAIRFQGGHVVKK